MKNYKQTDVRWCNVPYAGSTIGRAGCGPTACADIIGKTPKTVAAWMAKNGCASNGQGTFWGGITKALKHYGFAAEMLNSVNVYGKKDTAPEIKFRGKIKTGKYYGILLMGKSMFTSGGHYITIKAYNSKKGFYVLDPYSGRLCGWHKWEDFKGKVKIFYLIKKPAEKEADKPKTTVTYYKVPAKKTGSIVDALKMAGADSSLINRRMIASANGISGYTGSSEQNAALLAKLYKGTLKKA